MLDPGIVKITLTLLAISGITFTFFNLPGAIIIYVSVLLYGWYTGFTEITSNALIIAGIVTLASLWVDNLAAMFGAKKYGASSKGMLGAFLGGIIAFFLIGPIGILIGPLFGAILFELAVDPDLQKALKAGFGSFLGYLFGMFIKLIITLIIFVWALTVIW